MYRDNKRSVDSYIADQRSAAEDNLTRQLMAEGFSQENANKIAKKHSKSVNKVGGVIFREMAASMDEQSSIWAGRKLLLGIIVIAAWTLLAYQWGDLLAFLVSPSYGK